MATFDDTRMNSANLNLRTRDLGNSAALSFKPENTIVRLYAPHCIICSPEIYFRPIESSLNPPVSYCPPRGL